jgi:hypothetical protein
VTGLVAGTFQFLFALIAGVTSQFAHVRVIAGVNRQTGRVADKSLRRESVVSGESSDKHRDRAYCSALCFVQSSIQVILR